MCALRALRRSRRHYTPSPLIVPGYGRRQRALWKYRSMLDWTDIGKEGAFHTLLSEVAARRAL
jgi:hypothetical protein